MTNPAPDPRQGAELLCIGTELLLGNILNSNARWLAERLAALGVPHFRQEVVGDNRERVITAVRAASQRSRVLITSGGLGPTPDDLTTEAIAAAFDTPLQERPEVWELIQARLAGRGRPLAASNRRQAWLPEGAQVLPNPTGTAPGMIWSPVAGFTVLTFPGVPSELKAMWLATAEPWLRQAGVGEGVFASRLLRVSQLKQVILNVWRADLIDLISRAARRVGRKAGGIDVSGKRILQSERVGGHVGNNEVAPVQLRHAADAGDINLFAVAEAVRVGCQNARVGLGYSGDRLGRTCQNLQAVAVHPHRFLTKLQDVGVRSLELKRDQPGLDGAVLHLAQKLSAWPALHAAVRHDNHVGKIRQPLPVPLKRNLPLKAGRDFTGCEGAKGWCGSCH